MTSALLPDKTRASSLEQSRSRLNSSRRDRWLEMSSMLRTELCNMVLVHHWWHEACRADNSLPLQSDGRTPTSPRVRLRDTPCVCPFLSSYPIMPIMPIVIIIIIIYETETKGAGLVTALRL